PAGPPWPGAAIPAASRRWITGRERPYCDRRRPRPPRSSTPSSFTPTAVTTPCPRCWPPSAHPSDRRSPWATRWRRSTSVSWRVSHSARRCTALLLEPEPADARERHGRRLHAGVNRDELRTLSCAAESGRASRDAAHDGDGPAHRSPRPDERSRGNAIGGRRTRSIGVGSVGTGPRLYDRGSRREV